MGAARGRGARHSSLGGNGGSGDQTMGDMLLHATHKEGSGRALGSHGRMLTHTHRGCYDDA